MMRLFRRGVGLCFLLALCLSPLALQAQDNSLTAVGSGIVAPLFQVLAQAASVDVNVTVNGTSTGFEQFCNNSADIELANRAISVAEDAACGSSKVAYLEMLIGHSIAAFVANPADSVTQCLSSADIAKLLAPSASGQITNWKQVNADYADKPLSVYLPGRNTRAYTLIDSLVEGVGLRADAQSSTDTETIAAVSSTAGAVGVVDLASAQAAGDKVTILQLNNAQNAGCASPSAEAVEGRTYTAGERLFAYVNSASLAKSGLKDLLTRIASGADSATVESAGYSAPTAKALSEDSDILTQNKTGRQFSKDVTEFNIPSDVNGKVVIAGAAEGLTYIRSLTGTATAAYAQLTADTTLIGDPNGFRRMCNGEVDLIVATSDLPADKVTDCNANNIQTMTIDLGSQATVMVANASSAFLTCLAPSEIAAIWTNGEVPAVSTPEATASADATAEPTAEATAAATAETNITPEATGAAASGSWNTINAAFPDQPITLFIPAASSDEGDLLTSKTVGAATPLKDSANVNADALYRAAAVGNVEGGITFMTWADYQKVVAANQANIQLISVGEGSNCVQPSAATITDGSYLLSQPLKLIVRTSTLARPDVQSLLWLMASDANYTLIQNADLTGLEFGQLPDLRDTLQKAFNDAAMAATLATPEATAAATVEATAQATAEATPAS